MIIKLGQNLTYLTLGDITDVTSAILSEGDNGRGGPLTLSILNNLGVAGLHDCDARVGRAEIDANNGAIKSKMSRRLETVKNIRRVTYKGR